MTQSGQVSGGQFSKTNTTYRVNDRTSLLEATRLADVHPNRVNTQRVQPLYGVFREMSVFFNFLRYVRILVYAIS